MKITLFGAAGDVTGSAYYVETYRSRLLIDFGMFQGVREAELRNVVPDGLNPGALDAVLITHGHLDHVGRLPLLTLGGFEGPIYATPATIDMIKLILRDSAKVQAQDVARTNRKRQRAGRPPIEPMYSHADVEATLQQLQPHPYHDIVRITDDVSARMVEAGHMLGSVSIELIVEEDGREKKVVFSGDLGPAGLPVLKDAHCLESADLVFLESTYGDRDHRSLKETLDEATEIIKSAVERHSKILVPAFAVGRTQQILYHVAALFRAGVVPRFPIYLDSPMAIEATKIYQRHPDLYDEEARELADKNELIVDLEGVHACETAEESMKLNHVNGPCMIIAGSGMCHAGRIIHHLRNNLYKPETTVMIVGFQAYGTLGRRLVDGDKMVKIFGEEVAVAAEIRTLGGFSAHAGQTDLMKWLGCIVQAKPRVVLTHGESRGRDPLARLIRERHGIQCELPEFGDVIEL